jgi:hypothetical protein
MARARPMARVLWLARAACSKIASAVCSVAAS